MSSFRYLSVLATGVLLIVSVHAQINVSKRAQIDVSDKDRVYKDLLSSDKKPMETLPSGDVMPVRLTSRDLDSANAAFALQRINANIEYHQSLIDTYRHTGKVFEWQLTSSRVIFWVVILIVLSGLLLSWLQFAKPEGSKVSLKRNPVGSVPEASEGTPQGGPVSSVIKFSLKSGVEVSSPILGVLILVISLAFFYLYLVEVYQIRIVR